MKGKIQVRVVPCELYTRVVGYYRPIDAMNPGKAEEVSLRRDQMPQNLQHRAYRDAEIKKAV